MARARQTGKRDGTKLLNELFHGFDALDTSVSTQARLKTTIPPLEIYG